MASDIASPRVTGIATDATGDAPGGADIRTVRVSDDRSRGTLLAAVTMAGGPRAETTELVVRFGRLDAAGGCDLRRGDQVWFPSGPGGGFAMWSGTDVALPKVPGIPDLPDDLRGVTRLLPRATSTAASSVTATALVGQAFDCARAGTYAGAQIVDVSPVVAMHPARHDVPPPSPGVRTLVQLDSSYDGVAPVRRRHHRSQAVVDVTCVAARARRCTGRLVLRQQSTHRLLGSRRLDLVLGRTTHVHVGLRLTSAVRRAKVLYAKITIRPAHGPTTVGVVSLRR